MGLNGVSVGLTKREVCSGNGTLNATLSYGSSASMMLGPIPSAPPVGGKNNGTLYVYRADGSYVGAYNTALVYNIYTGAYVGTLSVSLPPGSYQVYAQTVVGGITTYSSLSAVAINALQTASVWLDSWLGSAPPIGAVTPLPYATTLTTDTPLGSTTTNVNGDYALVVTGITYNGGCSNSLRLTENVLPAFTAISASAPAPGMVLNATTIQYPAVSSGDYANNNFVQSSASAPLSGPEVKSYYFAGSQLVAVRTQIGSTSTLNFLHSDHLGSTSLATDASGNVVARQWYDAWGSIRSGGSMPTDIGYTGQHGNLEVGLLFYRARFYAPSLGRFLSADTIVPDGKNPQQFNRYAYALNDPIRYVDPTGHFSDDEIRKWTDIADLADFAREHPDLYKMLQLMQFGDMLYWAGQVVTEFKTEEWLGRATLTHDRLTFTGSSLVSDQRGLRIEDLIAIQASPSSKLKLHPQSIHGGFEVRRLMPGYGNHIPLVFQSGTFAGSRGNGWAIGSEIHPGEWIPSITRSERSTVGHDYGPAIAGGIVGGIVGYGASAIICTGTLGWGCPLGVRGSSLAMSVGTEVVNANTPRSPGQAEGDVVYTWHYANGSVETGALRGNQYYGPTWLP
jgi:RHS repeat-associated protein